MARSRAELVRHLWAFAEIWRERITVHPDPVVRNQARLTTAMYEDAMRAAGEGNSVRTICGQLSRERAALHGCKDAIEGERRLEMEIAMRADLCKSCGKPIVWARHETTGKAAQIDASPDPSGNCVLLEEGRYRVLTKAEREAPVAAERFTNHWQTCVDRAAWKETLHHG